MTFLRRRCSSNRSAKDNGSKSVPPRRLGTGSLIAHPFAQRYLFYRQLSRHLGDRPTRIDHPMRGLKPGTLP